MKSILIHFIFAFISISLSFTVHASEKNDLEWLAGHWVGNAFGGTGEEVWLPMSAGTMIGTYKQIMDGKVKFFEFMLIEKTDSAYTLKLKHFNADMTGWEEKDKFVEFPYVSSGKTSIKFDGLSFYLTKDGILEIKVSIGQKDGTVKQVINSFKNVNKN